MKKKIVKIVFIVLIILNIFVTTSRALDFGDIIKRATTFISIGQGEDTTIKKGDIISLSDSIFGILQAVALAVALVMILVLGIKYMTSSVEGKADIKATMVPFIVGAVVAFGAFTIWRVILQLIQSSTM